MEISQNVLPAIKSGIAALAHKLPERQDDTLNQEAQAMQFAMQNTVSDVLGDHGLRSVSVELERSVWTQRGLILRILVEDTDDRDVSVVREKMAESIKQHDHDPESRIRAIKISPMNARHMAGALMAAEAVREKRHLLRPVSSSPLPQT